MATESPVVIKGNTGKKYLNNKPELVDITPFVGQDSMGQFGVGIFIQGPDGMRKALIWGLVTPRFLIQSWRAMKLIEMMPRLQYGTLSYSWTFAKEKMHGYDDKYLDEQGDLFGSYQQYREARAKVLAMFPSDDDLKAMITMVEKHGLDIDLEEIEKCRRELAPTAEILKRLCDADVARRERYLLEAEERAERAVEQARVSSAATVLRRKSFFHRLFG